MPNNYQTHSNSSVKSTWIFEGCNNRSSYHLRALNCISWLRGVGTSGSWGVLKAVRFSIARDSCKPKPSNPSLSKPGSSKWKQPLKLPAPVASMAYQLANLGSQETFSNRQCQQRNLNGEERRASTPETQIQQNDRCQTFTHLHVPGRSGTRCIRWILKSPNFCGEEVQCNNCTWGSGLALPKDS